MKGTIKDELPMMIHKDDQLILWFTIAQITNEGEYKRRIIMIHIDELLYHCCYMSI